jgi:hypothetical protein
MKANECMYHNILFSKVLAALRFFAGGAYQNDVVLNNSYLCNEVLCKLCFSNFPKGQIEIRA